MCNRWQKESTSEITIDQIKEVFTGSLFSRVEDVSLHGGEPTLRKDLAEICQVIQDACPKIKRIWISTNGYGPERIKKRFVEIFNILNFRKIRDFYINVSIDGLEKTHDKIRGVKGGFEQTLETVRLLKPLEKKYPLKLNIRMTIQPLNIHEVEDINILAEDLQVPVFFQLVEFDEFYNIEDQQSLIFNPEEKEHLKKLIKKELASGNSTTNFFWKDYLSMMDGAKRKSPCAFDRYVFSLYPTGEVLPCSRRDWIVFGNVYDQKQEEIWYGQKAESVRRRMKKEVCPGCTSYCAAEYSLQKEFFTYLKFFVRESFRFRKSKDI
jgi:radical SAM protein with 4Fe4S-binding SPASM domain